MLLQKLDEYGVTLNIEKSLFGVQEMDFVGHQISIHGVRPLQSNVDSLLKLDGSTNNKEVQSFLGAINKYQKFIPNFASLTDTL